MPNPTQQADLHHQNSWQIVASMAALIIHQHQDVPEQPEGHQSKMKYEIHKQRKQQDKES